MNETTLEWVSFSKIVFLAIFSLLYSYGGITKKWLRRYIGSGVLTLGYIGYSLVQGTLSLWYLLCFPLLVGATSLGYGAEKTYQKIIKRTYCGLAYALASLPIAIVRQTWLLFGVHVGLCVAISNILGVLNPIEAREEETQIGFFIGFMPLFML